jgi:hypothetical protein
MRKRQVLTLVLVLLAAAAVAEPYKEKDTSRLLSGKVMSQQEAVLPNAVVYLTNTRTHAVKTYIVSEDGVYRFPALSPNIDYEVYAQFNGKKSDTKTMSQFDTRQQVQINLKVDSK